MPESRDDTDIFDRSFKQIIGSLSNRALISLSTPCSARTTHPTAMSDDSTRSR
jgi:hypothetical protein